MRPIIKITAAALAGAALGTGGYFVGAQTVEPEVRIERVVVTEEKEVEVPGPVRWKTRTPSTCREAIGAGDEMAKLLDSYEPLVAEDLDQLIVDTYNTVDDSFNQGASGGSFDPISNTLDQLENRYQTLGARFEEMDETWGDIAWYDPANACLGS